MIKGNIYKHLSKNCKKYAAMIIISYLGILLYWMFFGFGRRGFDTYYYNIIPFKTIYEYTVIGNFPVNLLLINMIGNIAVFVPFGMLLPILWGDKRLRVFLCFECGLLFLEALQMITRRGIFDVDDIILNSLGMLLGYGIYCSNKLILNSYNKRSDKSEYYKNNTQ